MEFSYKNLKFYGASVYFDIEVEIERYIGKVEQIIELAKGKGLILAIDSNARNKLWHDINTNQRGKTLEDFLITSDLHLMNEATSIPTFENIRGRSWIDLTLCNNILAQSTRRWTCGEEERCSDHKLICFDIVTKKQNCNAINHVGKRYHTKTESFKIFEDILISNALSAFECENNSSEPLKRDEQLRNKAKQCTDIEELN